MKRYQIKKLFYRSVASIAIVSSITSTVLITPITAYAGAAQVAVDETLYLNLDYYGTINKANVVKGINFNGNPDYTDFGQYKSLLNMSTDEKGIEKNGSVTWHAPADGSKFFFQGEMDPKAVKTPWTFDITYKVNGVVTNADEVGGKSGLVEMDIDAYPNSQVSEYMQNNMMLIVAVPVDLTKCYSVDAPDSQSTSIGQMNAVVFEALPGKEAHFVVRMGTDSFETYGAFMIMSPGTVGDLKKIKDLKELEDKFRDNTNSMMDDMDDVMDAVVNVSSQLDLTNEMLKDLKSGKDKIHTAKDGIFAGNDVAIQDIRNLSATLTPMDSSLKTTQWLVYDTNAQLNALNEDVQNVNTRVGKLNTALKRLSSSMSGADVSFNAKDVQAEAAETKKALDALRKDFADKAAVQAGQAAQAAQSAGKQYQASASEIAVGAGYDLLDGQNELAQTKSEALSKQYKDSLAQYEKGYQAYTEGSANYESNRQTVEAGRKALEEKRAEYEAGKAELETKKAEYTKAKAKYEEVTGLEASGAPLTAEQQALKSALKQAIDDYEAGQQKVSEFESKEAIIKEGEAQLAAGKQKLDESQKKLESSKKELDNLQKEAQDAKVDATFSKYSLDEKKARLAEESKKLQDRYDALNEKTSAGAELAAKTAVSQFTPVLDEYLNQVSEITGAQADELLSAMDDLSDSLENILDDGGDVSKNVARVMNGFRTVMSDADRMTGVANDYYDDIQTAISNADNVLLQAQVTADGVANAMQLLNDTLRNASDDFGNAADAGIEAGEQAIDNTRTLVDATKNLKNSGRDLRDSINNELDDEEDDNNFLNMDPEATKVSLTSDANQEPDSIAIICRSDEIKSDDDEDKTLDSEVDAEGTTAFQRIAAVFKKIWTTLKKILGFGE